MKLYRTLIGAIAVASLFAVATPADAQRRFHGGPGFHGRPGFGWHGNRGWGGPRFGFAVGLPFYGWGYPYGYPAYGYYAYPPPPPYGYGYGYAPEQVYTGRVVTRHHDTRDAKDVQSEE
jgi:hypothetical protein